MLTLDEAIEHERKQVEMYRCEYECECDYYCKCFVDDHADEFECIKKMNEHEQRMEWFEELKELRGHSCCYSKEDIQLNRNAMYNKAIDDAKSVIFQTLDNEILVDTLNLRLEQLKEGD